ncbi:hypothetical protein BpHYR1_046461 [Brachionus plicatilis]|uniref:Uncharacterized protein n=1 Tax=Brachionus plicatilis TaxID=10195 RepID=A0A3M7Q8W0_BRAPC|nr:hypothetical protein BpHYR1_046461 [Brachionus plicatilis]
MRGKKKLQRFGLLLQNRTLRLKLRMMVGEAMVVASENFKQPYAEKFLVRKFQDILADRRRSKSISMEIQEIQNLIAIRNSNFWLSFRFPKV